METSAQQALKAAQLAALVGEILEKYILSEQRQGLTVSEDEELLQVVDKYRDQFGDLVGINPEIGDWYRELFKNVSYWQEGEDD